MFRWMTGGVMVSGTLTENGMRLSELVPLADGVGHRLAHQLVQGFDADRLEHGRDLVVGRAEVSACELVSVLEVAERGLRAGHGAPDGFTTGGGDRAPAVRLPERCTRWPGFPHRRDVVIRSPASPRHHGPFA